MAFDRLLLVMPDWMLAQAAAPMPGLGDGAAPVGGGGAPLGGGAGGAGAAQGPGGIGWFLPLILVFFMLMIFMQMTAGRKEKKRRAEMMTTLRKHDKVRMLGGIIGTIAEIHDEEVVIKVDESTNTRIRFSKDAVQAVLKPAAGASSGEPEKVE